MSNVRNLQNATICQIRSQVPKQEANLVAEEETAGEVPRRFVTTRRSRNRRH